MFLWYARAAAVPIVGHYVEIKSSVRLEVTKPQMLLQFNRSYPPKSDLLCQAVNELVQGHR